MNENNFRTFFHCPKLYHFYSKEEISLPDSIALLESYFNKAASMYMKNGSYSKDRAYIDLLPIINSYNKKEQLLDSQYQKLLNKMTVYVFELFNHFQINEYFPIFGPFTLNKSFDEVNLKIKINGIFKHKNKTLHLVFFSPYKKRLNILNDPILHFLYENFLSLVPSHKSNRPKCIIHIFYENESLDLGYIKYMPTKYKRNYEPIFSTIKSGYKEPIAPCFYNCKYKHKCEQDNYV